MVVGHVGVVYGASALDRREPDRRAPVPWLLAAAFAPDLLDGVYAARQYCNPDSAFSHSLPVVGILAALFGVAAFLHTRSRTTALIVAALVCLHLPPDYLTGLKALWPGGPVVGLHIYRWGWLDFLAELPVVVGGWVLLRRAGGAPRWMISGFALAAMLLAQSAFDLTINVRAQRVPSRVCTR